MRTLLVAGEIALSTVCLSAAGLLLHSYVKLLAVDAGFDAQHVVTVEINLPPSRYPDLPQRSALLRSALDAVRVVPGVTSVGVSNQLPLGGEGGNNLVAPEGFTGSFTDRPLADIRQVNPEYFRTLGIPLRSGRVVRRGGSRVPCRSRLGACGRAPVAGTGSGRQADADGR